VKNLDEEFQNAFKEAVIEYQKTKGLIIDGILGLETAGSLSQEMMILDVQELTSHVFYPPVSRHAFFFLDYETVEKEPDRFYKGFESLEEVMNHALTIDDVKRLTQGETSKRFVLFVYFLDRLNPNWPINVCLASRPKRKTEFMNPTSYAVPERWPVLVETICIEKHSRFPRLYANLFINKEYVSSFRLR